MKLLKYIICGMSAMAVVGCTYDVNVNVGHPPLGDGENDTFPGIRPTVPLKKRPIVPPSKLPRPRVAEVAVSANGGLVVTLQPGVGIATVTVTERDGAMMAYIVDSEVLELNDVSEYAFDIAVEVDGVVEVYTVME